eukprot:SAG11_NODE_18751_length_482_cov_0.947781_2_plen_20_part_01
MFGDAAISSKCGVRGHDSGK